MSKRTAGIALGALVALALSGAPSPRSLAPGAHAGGVAMQPNLTPLFFAGIVGGDQQQGRAVLLRWYTLDQLITLDSAVIFRKSANGTRTKLSAVRRTRDAAMIKNVFYRPGAEKILADAKDTLVRIYGSVGETQNDFIQRVVDLLEGKDASEYADTRRRFLTQTNWGFAIVEGVGYLDYVNPADGPFTYELWQGDAAGNPTAALGQIVLDANDVDPIPAPQNLREVQLRGRDGVTAAQANHRRIYLNWESPPDPESAPLAFGYNIYRLGRAIEAGESFDSVKGELVRINKVPVLPPSPIEGVPQDQSYLFVDEGRHLETLNEDDLLTVGDALTYFAVPIDLLGQEGVPSEPETVTVRDTQIPDTPRALNVIRETNAAGDPILRALWNPIGPDGASYRLYRYRNYENAGKKGPFPPVDGLTEGLIAEVPAPAINVEKVLYDDAAVAQAPHARTYWYCVSAIDPNGNESALSPPAFAAIDVVTPPEDARITGFCTTIPFLQGSGSRAPQPDTRTTEWNPLFLIAKRHPGIVKVQISAVRIEPGRAEIVTPLEELALRRVGITQTSTRDESVSDETMIPIYRFEGFSADGRSVVVDVNPISEWQVGDAREVYTVELDIPRFTLDCKTTTEPEPGTITLFPGGDAAPFQLNLDCAGGAESIRLYRSMDGGDTFELVQEKPCDGAITIEDHFHPETLAEATYGIVTVDKHGNMSTPSILPPRFLYMGDFPAPALTEIKVGGLPASPQVILTWSGPKSGVQYYRARFERKDAPATFVELASHELEYDPVRAEFKATLDSISLDGDELLTNIEYRISVEAVPVAGATQASQKLPFVWSTEFAQGQGAPVRWVPRPLPPVVSAKNVDAFYSGEGGGAGMLPIMEADNATPQFRFPFLVWRRRTDKPGQPWLAVTPVLDGINYTGKFLDDPFFSIQTFLGQDRIYLRDNFGHVMNGQYEYLILELNKKTREIDRVVGPINLAVVEPG